MNRYVKVKGHENWFLVLESGDYEPDGLSEIMQEKILRSEVCALHDPNAKMDFTHRIILAATRNIDYESLAKKYGVILIRPIGSYMLLSGNEITEEVFDTDFPIDEFGDIVICENDQKAEYKWVEYLKSRFPNQKILTINITPIVNNPKDIMDLFYIENDDKIQEWSDKRRLILEYTNWLMEKNYSIVKTNDDINGLS